MSSFPLEAAGRCVGARRKIATMDDHDEPLKATGRWKAMFPADQVMGLEGTQWSMQEPGPAMGEEPLEDDVLRAIEDGCMTEPSCRDMCDLLRVHRSLGHPLNEFARTSRHAGAKPHFIRWVHRELWCLVCEPRPRPLARRPAMLPRSMLFNMVASS